MRQLTEYPFHTGKLSRPVRLAVVSDLHNEPYEDIFPLIQGADALLVPGDITNRYRQETRRGIQFLRDASKRLPTFYSLGNHEVRQSNFYKVRKAIGGSGAEMLINRYVRFGEIWIGGWYQPEVVNRPDMMDEFEQEDGVKVLLCHKPEQYMKQLRGRDVDLVVAGHAHGGQIRLGPVGIYSPGQGLFPRYTKGVIDGKMIVSAGAGNPAHMPRWGNSCEVLMITLD